MLQYRVHRNSTCFAMCWTQIHICMTGFVTPEQQFSIGGEKRDFMGCKHLCANFSIIKWCKGCKRDFFFRTGCGLQNELRTSALKEMDSKFYIQKCYSILFWKEVAADPTMDLLISKFIASYHLAWCGSNKAISLSLMYHHPGSITDKFQLRHANGCGFASHLHT